MPKGPPSVNLDSQMAHNVFQVQQRVHQKAWKSSSQSFQDKHLQDLQIWSDRTFNFRASTRAPRQCILEKRKKKKKESSMKWMVWTNPHKPRFYHTNDSQDKKQPKNYYIIKIWKYHIPRPCKFIRKCHQFRSLKKPLRDPNLQRPTQPILKSHFLKRGEKNYDRQIFKVTRIEVWNIEMSMSITKLLESRNTLPARKMQQKFWY